MPYPTQEEIVERENANPLSKLCPNCRKRNWRLHDLRRLEWLCLGCPSLTVWSETYLNAFWAGYSARQADELTDKKLSYQQ